MEFHPNKRSILPSLGSNDLMDIWPELTNTDCNKSFTISPSKFIQEMSLTTEERQKKQILLPRKSKAKNLNASSTCFVPTPNIVIFQSFDARGEYTVPLQVRNSNKIMMPLKMTTPKSPYFSARYADVPISKVAPGLRAEYIIQFTPDEKRDYNHYLKFETDGDDLYVPIIAIGPRPLLDIPDQITFCCSPVKIPSTKLIMVRNIGDSPAVFTFITNGYFKVRPIKGCLGVQDIMQLSVTFEAPKIGEYNDVLKLKLETGELLGIKLYGSSEDISVRLDKCSVTQDDTFIGLRQHKLVRLFNNSSKTVKFSWRKNKTLNEDLDIIESLAEKYEGIKDLEMRKDNKLKYYGVCNSKKHALSLERILQDEVALLRKEEFRFQHEIFSIVPESGEVWPKGSVEIIISFEPKVCGPVNTVAYLEVSGREERISLKMKGTGIGPYIILDIEILDIDFVFLCSSHKYELIAANKGHIPGELTFCSEPLIFGGKVEVTPRSRRLNPGEITVFILTFSSNRQGEFTEKLNFIISDSQEIVSLVLKGKVVSPTLHFDKTVIDFGNISVGFPTVKELTLSNLSMVPVTFSLRVLNDGTSPSVSSEHFEVQTVKPPLPKLPKEFIVSPIEGVVDSFSNQKVTIIVTSNIARRWTTSLMVDMWDSEAESVSCPIRYSSQIANVIVEPSNILIPFCFINFTYTRFITIQNKSRIPGYFYVVPQDSNPIPAATFTPNIQQGILKPLGTVKVALSIVTNCLGRHMLPLSILIFGHERPYELCMISCVGQGPVVTLTPKDIDWGEVKLLERSCKEIIIANESPIPATFTASVAKPNSPWEVTPKSRTLAPDERMTLSLALFLRDRGKYNDVLKVDVSNSKTLSASLTVLGVGCSLVMTPHLGSKYNLGTLFSHKKYIFEVQFKNEGTKPQSLTWCPTSDYKTFIANKLVYPPNSVFVMDPTKLDLPGGECKSLQLQAQSLCSEFCNHIFYCYSNVTKELQFTCEISAEFVEPLVEFNKNELQFWYNIGPHGIDEKLKDTVEIVNMSALPIAIHLVIKHPFFLEKNTEEAVHEEEIYLEGNESETLLIKFKAEEQPDRYCRIYNESLDVTFKEHAKKSSVMLYGEVNYPNVVILPRNIDFDCISVGSHAYREFLLINTSPLPVAFSLAWNKAASSVERCGITVPLPENQDSKENAKSRKFCEFEGSTDALESKTNVLALSADRFIINTMDDELIPPVPPGLKMPTISIPPSEIRNALFPLTRTYYTSDEELINAYKMARSSYSEDAESLPDCCKICDVTPFKGVLGKFESQVIAVRFHPDSPLVMHAEAFMEMEMGPTEIITIDAKASNLAYCLDKVHVEFGSLLFCETACQSLRIQNTGLLGFDFETNTADSVLYDGHDYPVETGILIITPKCGHVPPSSDVVLLVRYHPNAPGKFEERFQLTIGYLSPKTIRVSGFGVFPQVHLSLPRPEMLKVPPVMGYAAVASITPDWSAPSSDRTLVDIGLSEMEGCLSEEAVAEVKKKFKPKLDLHDSEWDLIRDLVDVPSAIDIQLAVERIMATDFISKDPRRSSSFAAYTRTIPNFFVPAYEIDCGVVIIGRSVEVNVAVSSYGQLPVVLYLVSEKRLKEECLRVRIKNRTELKIGGSVTFSICFSPKANRFKSRAENIRNDFHLEVQHGAKIPVAVLAAVTYPYVVASMNVIKYGDVKCGLAKVITLRLKNPGLAPCHWELVFQVKSTSRDSFARNQSETFNDNSVFKLSCTKGILDVDQYCSIQITFKPNYSGKFLSCLCVKMDESLEDLKITATGEGIEPALDISTSSITFEPTLPYPSKYDKFFEVRNPCPFPVEFYFPSFDDQIFEEDRILRAVALYYKADELMLPVRHPGDPLPFEIVEFYHMLLDELSIRYVESERERRELGEESMISATSLEDESSVTASQQLIDKRKKKIRRFKSRSHSYLDSASGAHSTASVSEPPTPILFEDKSVEEIEGMLHDYIRGLTLKEPLHDPLKAAVKAYLSPPPDTELGEPREGTLIIFHGAPFTNTIQAANKCALLIQKPAFSVDRIVLEEAAAGRCEAGQTVRDLIDQAYDDLIEQPPSPLFPDIETENEAAENNDSKSGFCEVLEDVEKKFYALSALRQNVLQSGTIAKGKANEADANGKKSGKSEKSQGAPAGGVKSMNPNAPIANITENLVFDILRYRLPREVDDGVVIESLDSELIPQRITNLSYLLKAAGNIRNILVIFLANSYESYIQHIMVQTLCEEKKKRWLKDESVRVFEEETDEDFKALELQESEEKAIRIFSLSKRRTSSAAFAKRRNERYRVRRLRKEALLKHLPVPPMPLSRRQERIAELEKLKATPKVNVSSALKGKPSPVSTKKESALKSAGKGKKEQLECDFDDFEMEMDEMKSLLEVWDRRIGSFVKSKETTAKGATPKKITTSETQLSARMNAARGTSVWIVDATNPEKQVTYSMCLHLRHMMRHYRRPCESDNWPLGSSEEMIFSVVPIPSVRSRLPLMEIYTLSPVDKLANPHHSAEETRELTENVSQIYPAVKVRRSDSQSSIKSKKKTSSSFRRRRNESRASVDSRPKSRKSIIGNVSGNRTLKSRWILQSEEKMRWRVRYYPREQGQSEQLYVINVVLWKNSYTIHCSGVCDIPAIDMDPEVMFNQTAVAKPENLVYTPTFFYSNNTFDFGSVISSQAKDQHCHDDYSIFHLLNKSALPADLFIAYAESALREDPAGAQHFEVCPNRTNLKPGENCLMTVQAKPTKLGPLPEVLMLFVKNNPKIETIRVKCHGVKVSLMVDPKVVNFDRMLLLRREVRTVSLINCNLMPLEFSLSGHDDFPQQFTFSSSRGIIEPLGTYSIDIFYEATQVQSVSEQPVKVEVFSTSDAEPVYSTIFTVNAETYDASVDIYFASREQDHVDFGDIKVENEYKNTINVKNSGKYNLSFSIEIDNELLAANGHEDLYVSPCEGKLLVGKLTPITICCIIRNASVWKRMPLIKIRVIEPYNEDELVALIPIDVSLRSYFSKYLIQPLSDYNLGPVKVNSQKTATLAIENKGRFPFLYTIESKHPQSEIIAEDVKSIKKTADTNKEKNKTAATASVAAASLAPTVAEIKSGSFAISPSAGFVGTKETAYVNIICTPTEIGGIEEDIIIYVTESPISLKGGTPLKLVADGCIPVMDLDDFKGMFREHYVFKNERELTCPIEYSCHTTFSTDTNTLYFNNICIGKTVEARVHLQNIGQVACHVTLAVQKTVEKNHRSSSQLQTTYFQVAPLELIIDPYTSGSFVVSFCPELMESYKAYLIIKLEMPQSFNHMIRNIELAGYGYVPQVDIVDPSTRCSDGQALVVFPPTTPGRPQSASFSFKNVGVVVCKVIMEFYKFLGAIFTLTPTEETEKMLTIWELSKPIDHTTIVTLLPGQTATFNVCFSPTKVKSYTSVIKLFIVDNPFSNLCYKLRGEAFLEEVVIEEIRTAFRNGSGDSDKTSNQTAPGQYFLNFGSCYIGKKKVALLRLANKTEKDYFKFEWDDLPYLSVSPASGHLYPKMHKEIMLAFTPEKDLELEDIPLSCSLYKIKFKEHPPDSSWDDRLVQYQQLSAPQTAQLVPNSKKESSRIKPLFDKTQISGHEPQNEIACDQNVEVTVNISAVSGHAVLLSQAYKVEFEDTYMFQTRSHPLTLENPGNVVLEYSIEFKSVCYAPGSKVQITPPESCVRPQTAATLAIDTSLEFCQSKKKRRRARPLTTESMLNIPDCGAMDCREDRDITCQREDCSYNPFQLENISGQILPKQSSTCLVHFSPMDLNVYEAILKISVPNLHPTCSIPDVVLTARSIMPFCHFSLPESDYLTSGRRDYSLPGPIGCGPGLPLDPGTKAVEIKVLGIGLTTPIRFHVINPTEEDYEFSWNSVTQIKPGIVPSFHCTTMDGRIQAGRQKLMVFSFVAQHIGIDESFWKFCLPKYCIETLFLFVGVVREPLLCFNTQHISLRPTVIGSSSVEILTLTNHEEAPIDFDFVPESLYAEGRVSRLQVEPSSGVVAAQSQTNIRIEFNAKKSGELMFRLRCKIKKIQKPIEITVETLTYMVQPLISFEDLEKLKHIADASAENVIDFGCKLSPNHPETITLTFTSAGKTSFYYEWIYGKAELRKYCCKVKFSVTDGYVTALSPSTCDLTLVFSKKSTIKNFPIALKICKGPTFRFLLSACASTPRFEFSFLNYDFGYCFLQNRDVCFNEVLLTFSNMDKDNLVLECSLQESSAFAYTLVDEPVPPGKKMMIPIRFYPMEITSYSDYIKFTVNSIYDQKIALTGKGTDFKVTLLNADDKMISLGAVRMGRKSNREFQLINKSIAPATLLLGFCDQFPVNAWCLAKPEENPVDFSKGHRLSGVITLTPSKPFVIKPQQVITVIVDYTPRKRTVLFSETISMQFQEQFEPLCVLSGCCVGPEFSLDRTNLSFGAVVCTCSSTLKLKLINSGDLGAKFKWETAELGNEFTFFPATGYISAESEVTISVTFQPTKVQSCIRKKVVCALKLSPTESYNPLILNITGDCIDLPKAVEVMEFRCLVRSTEKKSIEINNRTGNEWKLLPVVNGEYFKGFEAIGVPPLSSARYEVSYCPMEMTKPSEHHKGSVFFRLPDGHGLLYEFTGLSYPPGPIETIKREIPCKTKYTELLSVRNWLQYPQRFKVMINCVENENSDDLIFTCTGFENLDLAALKEKVYNLNFFSYKTGKLRFNVVFLNEISSEYMWYDVIFHIVQCQPLEMIKMRTGVRQSYVHDLRLENPLTFPVHYNLDCSTPDVHFTKSHAIPAESYVYAKLTYAPLHPGEKTVTLNATCHELGLFPRSLYLRSVGAPPEPVTFFETSLGTVQSVDIKVKNLSHSFATLHCQVDSEDFRVDEQFNVQSGQNAVIGVVFEPSSLANSTGKLFIESEQAGKYEFPLVGNCTKPTAKGPFTIKSGSGIFINFKNVLNEIKEFHMYVDNPAFSLLTKQEEIRPKNEYKIHVALLPVKHLEHLDVRKDEGIDPRFPVMGQLVVECFNPYIKWLFYLKGVLDKTSHTSL